MVVEKMVISLKYVNIVKKQFMMVILQDIKGYVKVLTRSNNKKFMYVMYVKNNNIFKKIIVNQ